MNKLCITGIVILVLIGLLSFSGYGFNIKEGLDNNPGICVANKSAITKDGQSWALTPAYATDFFYTNCGKKYDLSSCNTLGFETCIGNIPDPKHPDDFVYRRQGAPSKCQVAKVDGSGNSPGTMSSGCCGTDKGINTGTGWISDPKINTENIWCKWVPKNNKDGEPNTAAYSAAVAQSKAKREVVKYANQDCVVITFVLIAQKSQKVKRLMLMARFIAKGG